MSTAQPVTVRAPGGGADAGPVRRHLGLALAVIATAQLMVVLDIMNPGVSTLSV
jgi:hypothetical protein